MIDFKKEYELCQGHYSSDVDVVTLPESKTTIKNFQFQSECNAEYHDNRVVSGNLYDFELTAGDCIENKKFIYPVITPRDGSFDRAILFLHGLNERSWDKYFAWAKYLAERTGRAVIMFPIAYHINRAPKPWSDPRSMTEVAELRRQKKQCSTFVNAAISTRLEHNPEKFIVSGIQSYGDVMSLLSQIKGGYHPLFNEGTRFDIFAYSIGAFLAEILLLNNYQGVLRGSKLFIFCGGATFDRMNGISKYIMDESAFDSIRTLNSSKMLKRIRHRTVNVPEWLRLKYVCNGLGLMMSSHKRRRKREKLLRRCADSIYVVALKDDKVIPPEGICQTLKGHDGRLRVPVDVMDFPYHYSHEMPFPTGDSKIAPLVNRCFTVVFDRAVNFYMDR